MRKLLFLAIGLIACFLICFVAFIFIVLGCEQYYSPDPYCDTEMAKGFTPEKFLKIKPGMNRVQVESIIGKPLYIDTSYQPEIVYRYTNDGKLFYQEVPWYRCNDYAWCDAKVFFDSAMIVKTAASGWCYD